MQALIASAAAGGDVLLSPAPGQGQGSASVEGSSQGRLEGLGESAPASGLEEPMSAPALPPLRAHGQLLGVASPLIQELLGACQGAGQGQPLQVGRGRTRSGSRVH